MHGLTLPRIVFTELLREKPPRRRRPDGSLAEASVGSHTAQTPADRDPNKRLPCSLHPTAHPCWVHGACRRRQGHGAPARCLIGAVQPPGLARSPAPGLASSLPALPYADMCSASVLGAAGVQQPSSAVAALLAQQGGADHGGGAAGAELLARRSSRAHPRVLRGFTSTPTPEILLGDLLPSPLSSSTLATGPVFFTTLCRRSPAARAAWTCSAAS
jgi:hypothetical protein